MLIFGTLSFMPDFHLALNFFLIVIVDASISLMWIEWHAAAWRAVLSTWTLFIHLVVYYFGSSCIVQYRP